MHHSPPTTTKQAVIDSVLIFCFSLFVYAGPRGVWGGGSGGEADLYIFGTTVYSCMLIAMMYKVRLSGWLIRMHTHTPSVLND